MMTYFGSYHQPEEYRREELMQKIGRVLERLTVQELEALYYDMTTKSYANE